MHRLRSVPLLLLAAALGALCPVQVWAAGQHDFEVVNQDEIYYGFGKHPKAPAVLTADDVWAEIPEYKQILEEELTDEDPKYHLLMMKATERFNKALNKLAKRDGYDMLGEVGSIKANGKKKIPDVTKEMVKLVSRD
ncbi:MAG: hypothetical protein ACYTEZ_13300 [Planctomycetota bacterium]|jgi:hypothetical protein